MPVYLYRCPDHPTIEHRKEVIHSVGESPLVLCEECQGVMTRVPQPFTWYQDPRLTLLDKMDQKYREFRGRKRWQRKSN